MIECPGPYRRQRFGRDVLDHVVRLSFGFALSFRDVAEVPAERT